MNDPTALAPIRLAGRYHECCSPPEHAPRRTPLVDLIDRDELGGRLAATSRRSNSPTTTGSPLIPRR